MNSTSGERTIIPCEVAVRSVIPAIRALVAKELVENHGMKQEQVAEMLGITQSAVSKYSRNIRGSAIKVDDVEEIRPILNKMIILLNEGNYERMDFLSSFCQVCMTIRKLALMCPLCQKTNPAINAETCSFCLDQEK